jgi:hypothetical protein
MSIDALVTRMEAIGKDLSPTQRLFHDTYLRTTQAVAAEIHGGGFRDTGWVEHWDVEFAGLYLDAVTSLRAGNRVPGPWHVAFAAADGPRLPPLRHVLLGMNAHINYDLPQALIAVITDHEFDDPALLDRRRADHEHIDEILAARVAEESGVLKSLELPGDRTLIGRLLEPFNRRGTERFLKEARAKVWRNAHALAIARQNGRLTERLVELERLSEARVADLIRPGHVLLDLARRGFGVELE